MRKRPTGLPQTKRSVVLKIFGNGGVGEVRVDEAGLGAENVDCHYGAK
jgi:hypothetical protein